jgi:uncharacterized protein with FMN-binding domain
MKKFLITFVFLFGFSGYALYSAQGTRAGELTLVPPETSTSIPPAQPVAVVKKNPVVAPIPTPAPKPTPVPTPAPVPTGRYKDGTYTGDAADAYYGYIQVKATVTGGNLTNVTFLQYPSDRGTSIEINRQAMPMLTREAIVAQSADVNGVSGATDSSIAFRESLSSALSQAGV